MKKYKGVNIAIVTHQMIMGGIEKSLVTLCNKLLDEGANITLYLEVMGGELFSNLPAEIRIKYIFEGYTNSREICKTAIERKNIQILFKVLHSKIITRKVDDPLYGWLSVCNYLENDGEIYDYAFAYGAPVAFSTVFVLNKINARKKYAWIHNDPKNISLDIKKYHKYFTEYDKIICVSEKTRCSFLECFPQLIDRTEVFYNIINRTEIKKMSTESIIYDRTFSGSTLLTVGRLCDAKGQDIIPNILNRLRNNNYLVRWICVGDGEIKKHISDKIVELGIEEQLLLIGNKKNPYPYYIISDVYVQPSRTEAFCITITEAKILGVPIVTTNFDGASEQIQNGVTGTIVSFDEDEIYQAIKELLDDPSRRNRYIENLKNDEKRCVSNIEDLL